MVLGARTFRPEGGLWWRRSVSGPLPSWALPAERPLDPMDRVPTSTSRHSIAVLLLRLRSIPSAFIIRTGNTARGMLIRPGATVRIIARWCWFDAAARRLLRSLYTPRLGGIT